MKLTSRKKIAAILGTGLLAIGASGCSAKNIIGFQDIKNFFHSKGISLETNTYTEEELQLFKESLQEQFDSSDVVLDANSNKYVSSVYIDGIHVRVVLVDGSSFKGDLSNLELSNLDLEDLFLFDSEFEKNSINLHGDDRSSFMDEYAKLDKLDLSILPSVRVSHEIRITHQFMLQLNGKETDDGDRIIFSDSSNIDYSRCENIWFYGQLISTPYDFNNNPNLKTLILDNVDFAGYATSDRPLTIESPSLENLLINTTPLSYEVVNFDFNACPNLKTLSFGNGTYISNYNGIEDLENIEYLSFGNHCMNHTFDMTRPIRQKLREIYNHPDINNKNMAYYDNNFITDISALKNKKNLKVINISQLKQISSKQLYDVVTTLPNLEEIVGLEINNAEMYSSELISYCEEHGIKHPFTERSRQIKEKLQSIISEIITPDMDDKEKIKAISKYIMEHLSYDFEIANAEDKYLDTHPYFVRKAWGENLLYVSYDDTEDVFALCAGYTHYAQALLTEAEFNNFASETTGHIFNLVELDGVYYQIDLTNLDGFLTDNNIDINDFDFQVNSKYYLIPVDSEKAFDAISEPYQAHIQRTSTDTSYLEDTQFDTPLAQSNYIVYRDNTKNTQDNNSKTSEDTYKLLGLLVALGIATPLSAIAINKLLDSSVIVETGCPIWSAEDYVTLNTKENQTPTTIKPFDDSIQNK